ncbi:MAG: tetratricopeptide repeat protein [Magnetococcales bacterium]|nr:tetratricopeptide repeat protein [Magnetococcales bacterium]
MSDKMRLSNETTSTSLCTEANLEAFYAKALDAYIKEDWPEVVTRCMPILRAFPINGPTLDLMGVALARTGRREEGFKLLRSAIRHHPEIPHYYRHLAVLNYEAKEFAMAEQLYLKSLTLDSEDMTTHFNLATIYLDQGYFDQARKFYKNALQLEPDHYASAEGLAFTYELSGETDNAASVLDAVARYDTDVADIAQLRADPETICICALPKSAGTFLATSLANTLNSEVKDRKYSIDDGMFPDILLTEDAFRVTTSQRGIVHNHANASAANIAVIAAVGIKKILVHVRDPRQALLSYHHHCCGGRGLFRCFAKDQNFYKMEESERLQWMVNHYFQPQIDWIQSWMDYQQQTDKPVEINLTSFDTMLSMGQKPFIRSLCDALDHHPEQIIIPKRDNKVRFRKGDPKEWRSVFTEQQQEWMFEHMPEAMCFQFGWQR